MGMESYSITVLLNGISIEYEDCYQKLIGESKVKTLNIEEKLRIQGLQHIHDVKWLYNDYLEMFIYHRNGDFQGIEIKGCLSCLREGIKDSFMLINNLREWYGKVEIYVLGEKTEATKEEEFYKNVYELYKDKIRLFNKQYSNINLKVTCAEFYKELERQSKWYYKIFKSRI
ncbi:MAG: hypothetical protein IJC76_07790 [Lachnospiraceae bacterium]|nr:hypothetical protein [Lachnospiraceae bacterium]